MARRPRPFDIGCRLQCVCNNLGAICGWRKLLSESGSPVADEADVEIGYQDMWNPRRPRSTSLAARTFKSPGSTRFVSAGRPDLDEHQPSEAADVSASRVTANFGPWAGLSAAPRTWNVPIRGCTPAADVMFSWSEPHSSPPWVNATISLSARACTPGGPGRDSGPASLRFGPER
jgi:hypothetical protein